MGFWESLKLSFNGITSNKMRSFLTMLGIIIGISAVITITTIGSSIKSTLSSTLNQIGGANFLYVYLDAKYPENEDDWNTWEYPTLTSDDAITDDMLNRLAKYCGDDYKCAILNNYIGSATAKNPNGKDYANVEFQAVNNGYFSSLSALKILQGRAITDRDCTEERNTCMVSEQFVNNYFANSNANPIGQQVEFEVNGFIKKFTIVGVYQYDASIFGKQDTTVKEQDRSTPAFIPITMYSQLQPSGSDESKLKGYQNVQLLANSDANMDEFSNTVMSFFDNEYANNKNWQVTSYNASNELNTINTVLNVVTIAISVIAGISLIVGGVGVMNIMLVSITERTKEIGIRKALGAKNKSIRSQFIMEAVMICIIGGLIGIASGLINGIIIAKVAGKIIQTQYSDYISLISLSVSPNMWAILISVVFSMLTGVFFGYYPANKASKMDPIDALRYE